MAAALARLCQAKTSPASPGPSSYQPPALQLPCPCPWKPPTETGQLSATTQSARVVQEMRPVTIPFLATQHHPQGALGPDSPLCLQPYPLQSGPHSHWARTSLPFSCPGNIPEGLSTLVSCHLFCQAVPHLGPYHHMPVVGPWACPWPL